MRHASNIFIFLCAAFILASCGSQKKALDDTLNTGIVTQKSSASKVIESVKANNLETNAVTAKIKARIDVDGKDISTSGTLKMKKDEVIQVSLVDPILGITEVARLEFGKDRVLVIDRLNRRYIDEPYSKVSFLQKANINFDALQSLFWNEIFQVGKTNVDPDKFNYMEVTDNIVSLDYEDRLLTYSFTAEKDNGHLTKTEVHSPTNAAHRLTIDYSNFEDFNGKDFPSGICLQFKSGQKIMSLAFNLSSLRENAGWEAHSSVSKKYEKVDAEKLLKILFGK